MKKSVQIFKSAVKKWPDDKICSFWAAHALALSGDVIGGQQILRRLCDRDLWARRPDASQMLAEYSLAWGDPSSAVTAMKDAMKRGNRDVSLAQRVASARMQQGAWQAALDTLLPHASDPLVQRQRVESFVAMGKAAEVQKVLADAHQMNPADARAMTLLGVLYSTVRLESQAALWLDRAISARDDELGGVQPRTRRCGLRTQSTDLEGTITDLSIAREANLTDTGAALLLSEAYLRKHDLRRAASVLAAALAVTPSAQDVRIALIELERSAPSPNWERISALIDEGRTVCPSDYGWDAAEAKMWLARGDASKAAALMRRAAQVAGTETLAADPSASQQPARMVRALIQDELWMLLAAQANQAATEEADKAISTYGSLDTVAAWAHFTRATVQRRTSGSQSAVPEYVAAISAGQAAGGFDGARAIVEAISAEAGVDESLRRMNDYFASLHSPQSCRQQRVRSSMILAGIFLRIDMLRRNASNSAPPRLKSIGSCLGWPHCLPMFRSIYSTLQSLLICRINQTHKLKKLAAPVPRLWNGCQMTRGR